MQNGIAHNGLILLWRMREGKHLCPGKTTLSEHAVLYLPVSTFVGTGFLFTLCKEKLMKRHLNTSYRLVWNHITGAFVVASELARARGKRGGVAVALSLAAVTSLPVLAADIVVHPGETVNGGTLVNHDNQFVSGTADGVTVSTGLELGPDSDDNTGGQQIAQVALPETPRSPQTVCRMSWQVAVPRIRLSVPVEDRICAGRLTVLSLTVVNNGYMQAAVHPER